MTRDECDAELDADLEGEPDEAAAADAKWRREQWTLARQKEKAESILGDHELGTDLGIGEDPGILVLVALPKRRPRIVKTVTTTGYLKNRLMVGVPFAPDKYNLEEDGPEVFEEVEFVDARWVYRITTCGSLLRSERRRGRKP